MTCKQLGGACDMKFHAETFEEISGMSHDHGKEMFMKKDEAHLRAMQEMRVIMQDPESMQEWMGKKRAEFDTLPED